MKKTSILSLPITVMFVMIACSRPEPLQLVSGAPASAKMDDWNAEQPTSLPQKLVNQRDSWIHTQLAWADEVLDNNPPDKMGNNEARKLALAAIDDPLHLTEASELDPVAEFFLKRVGRALEQIEQKDVPAGQAVVWKLYNHSFVIKTTEHTWGHDIFGGVGQTRMSAEMLARLADILDAAFVSHYHSDHADPQFARMMVERSKPVYVPASVWQDEQFSDALVRVKGGTSGTYEGLRFVAFPGHQGPDIPNICYLVTSSGVTTLQTGDQNMKEDFPAWIEGLGNDYDVDILLPNCWTYDITRMIGEVDPNLVITGHENELGHMVYKRESYGKTFRKLEGIDYPYSVMTWAESYHYSGK